jgi:predicted  nucleic acid-binding Zn-ribbon protein
LLPPDWLKEFRRLEPTEGPDALSPLTGRSCSSCYTEVTAQQFAILRAGQISACKNCGKILFLAD